MAPDNTTWGGSRRLLRQMREVMAGPGTAQDRMNRIVRLIAGRPLEAMALVGLGFRALSMPPASIGPVKAMARSLTVAPLTEFLPSLADSSAHSVRAQLRAFVRDHLIIH